MWPTILVVALIIAVVSLFFLKNKFKVLKSFKVTVPEDYNHEKQLSTINPNKLCNDNITDENFKNATNPLIPGKTYTAKLIGIRPGKIATSEEILEKVYKRYKAILVGGQGLSLVRQLKGDEFPKGNFYVSFDKKDALWADASGYHRVPYVGRGYDGGFKFHLGCFEFGWYEDCVFLCLCD